MRVHAQSMGAVRAVVIGPAPFATWLVDEEVAEVVAHFASIHLFDAAAEEQLAGADWDLVLMSFGSEDDLCHGDLRVARHAWLEQFMLLDRRNAVDTTIIVGPSVWTSDGFALPFELLQEVDRVVPERRTVCLAEHRSEMTVSPTQLRTVLSSLVVLSSVQEGEADLVRRSDASLICSIIPAIKPFEVSDGTARLVQVKGDYRMVDGVMEVEFLPGEATYPVSIPLSQGHYDGNGISIDMTLEGWRSIEYVAVGWVDQVGYQRVLVPKVEVGRRTRVEVSEKDVLFLLNRGENPTGNRPLAVRLVVKGVPDTIAKLVIHGLAVFRDNGPSRLAARWTPAVSQRALEFLLARYVREGDRHLQSKAETFLLEGRYPTHWGHSLAWRSPDVEPESLRDVNTFRYLYQAMSLVSILACYEGPLEARARTSAVILLSRWVSDHTGLPWSDTQYSWYDHGTAERLIALLLTLIRADVAPLHRQRLLEEAIRHSRLLEADAFYARNQASRYHNHAWFQDAALLASSVFFAELEDSSNWQRTAMDRLRDQFETLIVRDDEFSVFAENSIGYHHGTQGILKLVQSLLELMHAGDWPDHVSGFREWSAHFRYPDGRAPSQGDSFRLPPGPQGRDWSQVSTRRDAGLRVLQGSGHATIKGIDASAGPFDIYLLATSASRTHKHADNLSLCFWFAGIEWMVDPSFYSHEYTDLLPAYLRGPWAHSQPFVPKVAYSIEPGKSLLVKSEHEHLASVGGVSSAQDGFLTRRWVVAELDQMRFAVQETVDALDDCKHSVDAVTVYHLGEGVDARVDGPVVVLSHTGPSKVRICMAMDGVDRVSIVRGLGEDDESTSIIGYGLREHQDSTSIVLHYKVGTVVRCDFTLDGEIRSSSTVDAEMAQAWLRLEKARKGRMSALRGVEFGTGRKDAT